MRGTLPLFNALSTRIFDTPSAARFLISSPTPASLPGESFNEFVFAGRANVGKSSLLNSVLGRKDLVKTSSKAGHTRALNFFQVGADPGRLTLVDAPGYGERGRPEWGEVFERYIGTRQRYARLYETTVWS
ncbi:hypothetical protein FRC08_010003 [Ceratobasidium sp. 394]|nr:hypothetical protein FRC08_010003 [Ceratobasidium sp. 394]